MISDILYERLTTEGTVSALISTRCWPGRLPEDPTYPAVVYQLISGPPANDGNADYYLARYQITSWAATHTGAETLANATKTALRGYQDKSGSPALAGMRDVSTQETFDEPTGAWGVLVDFIAHVIE